LNEQKSALVWDKARLLLRYAQCLTSLIKAQWAPGHGHDTHVWRPEENQ